ncbi:galactose-1-phosphate uridylyltransferase, partial [Candidatus Roizmanbacteria bacterium CG_4_8_14_3_um_filter_36_12]
SFYLRIIPRFMERAGFELSTGIMVNSVSPEKAAEELKKTIL